MSPWRNRGKKLAIAAGVLFGLCAAYYGYLRFSPTRHIVEARLAKLTNGRSVLVVQELVGSSLRSGQSLRFDILDAQGGGRLHRLLAPLGLSAERLEFLGGKSRQWWGQDEELILLDLDAAKIVADAADVLSQNPILRGELHRTEQREYFFVDGDGALHVKGGDGQRYALDSSTLKATPVGAAPKPALRIYRERRLPHVVSDSENFVTRTAAATPERRGDLMLACRTVSAGPCTLRSQLDDEMLWQLGDAELDDKSVIGSETRDAQNVYVYVAWDGVLGRLFGGSWLYAVELTTGRVLWQTKL
jgi:hypothetical protein